MKDIFGKLCSVYVDAHDNYGKYVDRETGEIIQQMTIRDFCLTDRWKTTVDRLRGMIAEYGAKEAKAMPQYKKIKTLLPGATLSGLFELRDTFDKRYGRMVMKSRITENLKQHTGFLCIDIDRQDNQSVEDMTTILRVLRHRPEVALCMKSCSGTGYFALIPLAYPEHHKEQFKAIRRDYAALGIVLDVHCSDITRIRFASYDDNPYINENAIAYSGIDMGGQVLVPRPVYRERIETKDALEADVERLVEKIEQRGADITGSYDQWLHIGMSLYNLGNVGLHYWWRLSVFRAQEHAQGHSMQELQAKWSSFAQLTGRVSIRTFFYICKQNGFTLYHNPY